MISSSISSKYSSLVKLVEGNSVHCLTGDTKLFVKDGYGRVQVRKLNHIMRKRIYPEVLTTSGWKKVKTFIKRGKEEVYLIKLRNGISMKVTADHPHLVFKNLGWTGVNQDWQFFTADTLSLNPGDALLLTDGFDGDDIGDFDFGRFLGWVAGDGYIEEYCIQITFAENELDYLNFCKDYSSRIGSYTYIFHDKVKKAWRLNCFSHGLVSLVKDYLSRKKILTWKIWRLSRDAREGFLQGMWESDGRKNMKSKNIGLNNRILRDQLAMICASLGKKYLITDFKYDKHIENRIVFDINENEKFNFTKRFLKNAVKIDKIIKLPQKEYVYDLSVEGSEFTLANGIVTHNCDFRIKWDDKHFMQFVITQNDAESYIRTFKGENNPRTNNVEKGLVIIKPSAITEPEEKNPRVKKAADDVEILLDEKGAKLLASYNIPEKSYVIRAGEIGASESSDAYMSVIWTGRAKSGVMREDLKELFLYPDEDLPKKNKELFNGRFIVRAFKQNGQVVIWFWKAKDDPYPMNPTLHKDQGDFSIKKPEDIKKIGRDAY